MIAMVQAKSKKYEYVHVSRSYVMRKVSKHNASFIPTSSGVPSNALLAEDGSPILNEDGSYILTE